MARTSIQRISVGLIMLAFVIISILVISTQQGEAQVMPSTTQARVFSEQPDAVHVLVMNRAKKILLNSQVNPGEQMYFRVPLRTCAEHLLISLNGAPAENITGNLCPEHFPDEEKTIYLSRNEVVILGEDRD